MSKTKYLLIRPIRVVLDGPTAVTLMGATAVLVGCAGPAPQGLPKPSPASVTKAPGPLWGTAPGRLPKPSVVCADAPPEETLNAEQQARKNEVEAYLARGYAKAGWKILLTTKTCMGDVWDWLDPATVPGSEVEPPPPPAHFSSPAGVKPAQTELEVHAELRGPPNTVPMLRPSFMPYVLGDVPAASVEDFLAKEAHGGPAPAR